ncbi:hypothetical protein [Zavarzinia sp. CC-PAN008]|uniref:hypothetical protein n=1 Tax=Zavarzinia sp. CC-PAN008 TaxID=3243332 RepID=UPI003F746FFA
MTADGPLSRDDIEAFVRDGFVRLDGAFPGAVAAAAREILWRDVGCNRDDPATWPGPVVRLGLYSQTPFLAAAGAPALRGAFDQLVGRGRWSPIGAVGTFPIRFPSAEPPGDDGWHIDASFGTEAPDFMDWRANVASRGRALLVLMLFSDVGPLDAPTRIRVGSHADIARLLAPAGEAGLRLRDLSGHGFATALPRDEVAAIGPAGTVYLCHPFLVHAAQAHRGTRPRILAQPPLLPVGALDPAGPSPVERAIRAALGD